MPDPDDLNPLLNAMSGQSKKLDDLMDILLAQAKMKSSGKKGDTGGMDDFMRSLRNITSVVDILDEKFTNFKSTTAETNAHFNVLTDAAKTGAVTTSQLFSELGKRRDEVDQFNKEVEALQLTAERLAKSTSLEEQREGNKIDLLLKSTEMQEKIAESAKIKKALTDASDRAMWGATGNIIKAYASYEGIVKDAGKSLKAAADLAAGGLRNIGSFMSSGDMFGPVKAGFDTVVDVTNKGAQALSKGGQSAGDAMAKSANPLVAAVGAVVSGVSAAGGHVSEAAAKLAKEGFSLMVEQTKKFIGSFNQMSASGALFADGMTGMISAAGKSGLTVEQFSKVVAGNTDNLIMFGGSVSGGIKKLGEVTGRFSADAKRQMLNLGFSFEEQASFTAEYMDGLARSGKLAGKSQTDLANESVKYMTSLRVISSITGEDAKKAQARAKAASEQAAVQAKLSEMGPDAMAKYQQMVKMYGAEYEGAIGQLVTTGAVTGEAAVALAQMPTMAAQLQSGVENIGNSSVDLTTAQRNQISAMNSGAAAIKEEALEASKSVGLAAQYGKGYQEASKMFSGAVRNASKSLETDFATAGTAAEDQANTQDATTTNLAKAGIAAQDLQIGLQALVEKALPNFTNLTNLIMTGYHDVFKAIREFLGTKDPKKEDKNEVPFVPVSGDAKQLNSLKKDAMAAGDAAAVSNIIRQEQKNLSVQRTRLSQRDAKDVLAGPRDATFAKILEEYNLTEAQVADIAAGKAKKLATGGITNGLSFAGESGPEAVIPLPDGKTIPVTIKLPTQEAMPADTAGSTGVMASLTSMIDKFSTFPTESKVKSQLTAMEATSTQFNSAVLSALKAQTELLTMAMTKYDNIANTLRDGNDLHKKILNASI